MTGLRIVDPLLDAFDRVAQAVHGVLDALPAEHLHVMPEGRGNSIAWLLWHLTRVQDDHVADAARTEQVWLSEEFVERFGLPLEPSDTGFGHRLDEAAAVRVNPASLLGDYHDAVARRTARWLGGLGAGDLQQVVDTRWDPPVTLAVRLVSVIEDDMQHVGQAAYVKGLLGG